MYLFYIDESGTRDPRTRICAMPLFVRSELSNGVQLADLCSYNVYRHFRYCEQGETYRFFDNISGRIWDSALAKQYRGRPFFGLRVFPNRSPLTKIVRGTEEERAPDMSSEARGS